MKRDFREFLFTVTRQDTDVGAFRIEDLADNLAAEFERLEALTALLMSLKHEEFEPRALGGVALLLEDLRIRMRAMMECALRNSKKTTPVQHRHGRATRGS